LENITLAKADELAHKVYKISKKFPKSETYELGSQLRRAGLSVSLNIIEGFARNNQKEFKRFLEISYASLKEVMYILLSFVPLAIKLPFTTILPEE